jgi:hypothetical protein
VGQNKLQAAQATLSTSDYIYRTNVEEDAILESYFQRFYVRHGLFLQKVHEAGSSPISGRYQYSVG